MTYSIAGKEQRKRHTSVFHKTHCCCYNWQVTTIRHSLVHSHLTTMKIYGTFLALCVFHSNVWATNAFLNRAPKALTSKGSKITDKLTPSFSYLDQLAKGDKPGTINGSKVNGVSGASTPPKITNSPPPRVSTTDERTVRRQRHLLLCANEKSIFLIYGISN